MLATSRTRTSTTTRVSADDWFAAGERRAYDPSRGVMLDQSTMDQRRDVLYVFERVVRDLAAPPDARWTTLLPGFPDGSYGFAQVNALLGPTVTPHLFVEYVGQGDSDKPAG